MKKAFYTLAAAILVLSGCQKNDEVLESAVKARQKAVLTATIPGKTTKVSYEEVAPENVGEFPFLKAAWDAKDAISLIALDHEYKVLDVYNYTYEGEAGEASGAFTGDAITGASHIVAIYPALEFGHYDGGPAEGGWSNRIIQLFPKGVSAFNVRCDNTIVPNIEGISDYTLMSGDVTIDDSGEMETALEQENAVIKLYNYKANNQIPDRFVLYDSGKFDFSEGKEPEHNSYAVFTFEDRSLDTSETVVDIKIPDGFTFEGNPYIVVPPMSTENDLNFLTVFPAALPDLFELYRKALKAGFFYILD